MGNKTLLTESAHTFTDRPIKLDVPLEPGDIVENPLPMYIVWGTKPDRGGITVEVRATGGADALEKAKTLRPECNFIASHIKRT